MHNDRVNRVIDDLFNPRGYDEYHVSKDHFIERHRPTLARNSEDEVRTIDEVDAHENEDWYIKEGAETFIGLNLTTNTIRRTGRRI